MTLPRDSSTLSDRAHGAVKRQIRSHKEDSAYLYMIFESHEGIASYTTVNFTPGDAHRDIELQVPLSFVKDVEELLNQLGDIVYDLDQKSESRESP